jgi:polyphosphate kinase
MSNNLDLLFADMEVLACEFFHVTRNANTAKDEGRANDLLAMIESEVRDRKFAPIVRVVVQTGMDTVRSGMLAAELGLDSHDDVYQTSCMLAPRDLMEIAGLPLPELHDPAHHPAEHRKLLDPRSIFHIIRDAGSILLQHPYESFTNSVERFVDTASTDPKVRAIKMTLYRTSSESKIVDKLIDAAQNGKQVAVAVELQARFDEAANIRWASRMEEAGVHVTYGVVGLKTHCKVILVVRQDYGGLKRYIHVGTGNYHAGTARLYSDLGLLTCDDAIGQDVTELFNYLTTGYSPKRPYKKILPAPKLLKKSILSKITREVEKHSKDNPGLIQFKTNALEDVDITRALYEASQAGVKVDLLIRDTCRLRPGVPGLSDNIHVVSIVGRFLEHTRIYYFRNGGDEEYFIGSADMMMRNLESRVEVVAPVEPAELREELRTILQTQLEDQRSAWDMQADGTYIQRTPQSKGARSSQETLVRLAEARSKDAERRNTRSAQKLRKRNIKR